MQSIYPLTRDPITGKIRKIVLYYHINEYLRAIRFFDAAGKKIYESSRKSIFTNFEAVAHEILL